VAVVFSTLQGSVDNAYHVLSEFCESLGEWIFLVFQNEYSSTEIFEHVRIEG